MPSENNTCRIPTCPVNTGGECLEGFSGESLKLCPNFGAAPSPDAQVEEVASTGLKESHISVFSGQALTTNESNTVAGAEQTQVVLLAGPVESGKTTLALSIYEAFRKGPYAGCLFVGSRSLLGFEERCHLSRGESELDRADTERTKPGIEEVLLHLCVRPQNGQGRALNLLLCDMSGELFEAANQSDDALLRIPLLKRADRTVMFLDGEKLTQKDIRQRVRQDLLTLIRACIQVGRLQKRSIVDVVFSKQDLIRASVDRNATEEFQAAIEEDISKRFGAELGQVTFHRIAARPEPDEALSALFSSWITAAERRKLQPTYPDLGSLARQIDRFIQTGTLDTPGGALG